MLASHKRPSFLIAAGALALAFSLSACGSTGANTDTKPAATAKPSEAAKPAVKVNDLALPKEVKGLKLTHKEAAVPERATFSYSEKEEFWGTVQILVQESAPWSHSYMKSMGAALTEPKAYHSDQVMCGIGTDTMIMCYGQLGPYLGVFMSKAKPDMSVDQFAELVVEIVKGTPK